MTKDIENKIEVKTFYGDKRILSRIVMIGFCLEWAKTNKLAEQLIELRDSQVRQALINMGWIPPKGKHECN